MSMYPHRGMGAAPPGSSVRLNELLDQVRAEFENQRGALENLEHQGKSLQQREDGLDGLTYA